MAAVALDSNLLLLYVVGFSSRELIERHKRLRQYTTADFDLLLDQLSSASEILLTPNTLTETSNLIDHIGEPARGHIYATFRALLHLPTSEERYIRSTRAAAMAELPRLGLADCALLEACGEGVPLLTADLSLYLAATQRGLPAVNFHHLRDL